MPDIINILNLIPVYLFLILFLVFFGIILILLHKHYSKSKQKGTCPYCEKIVEEFIANNDYPKINTSFDNLIKNKHKLSSELNVNLKGYILK